MANKENLAAFVELGAFFNQFCESDTIENDHWLRKFEDIVGQAEVQNKWYTRENLLHAIKQWGTLLTEEKLEKWLSTYQMPIIKIPKTIAIIMAGNIPLVGFHDFLCVLLSGNRVLAKLSSNDKVLLPFITEYLVAKDTTLKDKIDFTQEQLTDFDAVIATGSNNTSRYFEYYFGKYPSIIRRNRNSIAVLTEEEQTGQLEGLGEDIFRYFGLGCRSVSKLFVPQGYDFDAFFKSIFRWKHVLEHHKYVNNYDYNKAVYLMSEISILDNGFLILKEDMNYGSPIATLFFEYYTNLEELKERLSKDAESIQCIVSDGFFQGEIQFGKTQAPVLTDYADGVDTMQFLAQLSP
jgi:hypothetical protein